MIELHRYSPTRGEKFWVLRDTVAIESYKQMLEDTRLKDRFYWLVPVFEAVE